MSNNPSLYNAAFAGLAGGVQATRWPVSSNPSDYVGVRNEILEIARAIDSAIPAQGLTSGGNLLMAAIALSVMVTRYPTGAVDPQSLAQAIAAYWTLLNGALEPATDGGCCVSVLSYTGGKYHDVAGINAALADPSVREICFPAGTYTIDDYVVSELEGKVLNFAPGAVFLLVPGNDEEPSLTGPIVTISGANSQIIGSPTFLLESQNTGLFSFLEMSGDGSYLEQILFQVNAKAAQADLLVLTGEEILSGPVTIDTEEEFRYGVNIGNDAYVSGVVVFGITARIRAPDPVSRGYGALLNLKGNGCSIYDLTIENTSQRSVFAGGVVVVDGTRNNFYNPLLRLVTGATYGFYRKDAAEFLQIFGGLIQGRNNGTFAAGSEGIYSGHAAGHLKVYGTAITGWQYGCGFHGSTDTPCFYGAVIANNELGAIKIDSNIAGSDWPISGLLISGCYGEAQVSGSNQVFVHVVSGALRGGSWIGSFVGTKTAALQVEAGVTGTVDLSISGNRFSGVNGQPLLVLHSLSFVYWGLNDLLGVTILSNDLTKVFQYNDPALSGMVVGALGIGTNNNHLTRLFTGLFTTNFGNINAGATVSLTIAFTGIQTVTTAGLRPTMDSNLCAKAQAGIVFQFFINAFNQVVATATNITGAVINSVTGGIRLEGTQYG